MALGNIHGLDMCHLNWIRIGRALERFACAEPKKGCKQCKLLITKFITMEFERGIHQSNSFPDQVNVGTEVDTYAEHNAQNGVEQSSIDYLFEPEDSDELEEHILANPDAVLEDLQRFEREHLASTEQQAFAYNDQFASLLQAAATAGGEEAARIEHERENTAPAAAENQVLSFYNRNHPIEATRSKRKRAGNDDGNEGVYGECDFGLIGKRRKRITPPVDEEELAQEREIWGSEEEDADDDASRVYEVHLSPMSTANARAAGVHSAAALFRKPSPASKKYTRK